MKKLIYSSTVLFLILILGTPLLTFSQGMIQAAPDYQIFYQENNEYLDIKVQSSNTVIPGKHIVFEVTINLKPDTPLGPNNYSGAGALFFHPSNKLSSLKISPC